MEVHAHTHTPRKKWTHYLWEFLMLFLAVFCGFLAELQLEHKIEKQREKQYMVTMLEDLKNDTAFLNSFVYEWNIVNSSVDSVSDALHSGTTNKELIKTYRHLNNALNFWGFAYHDRTVSQLKNSGGFRLIRDKDVANKIIKYDQFNNNAMKKIAEQYNFFYEVTVQLRNKVFVQFITTEIFRRFEFTPPPPEENKWIDSLINSNKVPYNNENYTALLFEFKNALLAYRKDFSNMEYGNVNLKAMATELLQLIQKNYHLQ